MERREPIGGGIPALVPSADGPGGRAPALGSTPVTLQGPKCSYLYIRVLEVGNLGSLRAAGSCLEHRLDVCVPGVFLCSRGAPTQLQVTLTCHCLERPVSSTQVAKVDWKQQKATFNEELLAQCLSFYGADKIAVKLQATSGTVLGEAFVPLRLAVASTLGNSAMRSMLAVAPVAASSGGWAAASTVSSKASWRLPQEAALASTRDWLPVQRFFLSHPGTWLDATSELPYVEMQLLQLVEGSIPRIEGTSLLTLALHDEKEQLVRACLSLGGLEKMSSTEGAVCLDIAIKRESHHTLVLLLEHFKPAYRHLLAAICNSSADLVKVLLQAGGPSLLLPGGVGGSSPRRRTRSQQSAGFRPSSPQSSPRFRGVASSFAVAAAPGEEESAEVRQEVRPLRSRDDLMQVGRLRPSPLGLPAASPSDSAAVSYPSSSSYSPAPAFPRGKRPSSRPMRSPLAEACALGAVSVVEALCQWAQAAKVHVDPTAPLGSTSILGGSPSWESMEGGVSYGDPPMVCAVRARTTIEGRRSLVNTLAKYGFSTDVRSPSDSWTPLLAAVEVGNLELVTLLVRLGARLSADRFLGFTPLHLACQIGQWHLVPFLVETMRGQHESVAAWGPSPQYVSLNIADAYGRSALDIALLRYFSTSLSSDNDSQKAVDVLRAFLHREQSEDPSVVCGWEVLPVLRLLESMPPPPSKQCDSECFSGSRWTEAMATAAGSVAVGSGPVSVPAAQAVRALVCAGAQTRWLAEDILRPRATRSAGSTAAASHASSRGNGCPGFSVIDLEDFADGTQTLEA